MIRQNLITYIIQIRTTANGNNTNMFLEPIFRNFMV